MLGQVFNEVKQTLKTPGFWLLLAFDAGINIYTAIENFDPILFALAMLMAIGAGIFYHHTSKENK